MLAKAWFAGNSMNGTIPADPWSLVTGVQPEGYRLTAPIEVAPVKPESAMAAYPRVLAEAGASKARDSVDLAIIAGVRDRTGHQIDSQSEVGGWPVLATAPAPRDSDGDGMPGAWERSHGLDPRKSDSAGDRDHDGFTNIEEYLNSLVQ